MGTRTAGSSDLKVLMLPWLAYGHMTPHLQLAKKLVDRGIIIYFCSTPVNLTFIKNKIPEKYSSTILLVELHLPETPELPSSCHTTNGLPPHLLPSLSSALAGAKPKISDILRNLGPDLVIYDVILPWTASLTSAYSIPAVQFLTSSATSIVHGWHLATNPSVEFPFPALRLSDFHQAILRSNVESAMSDIQEQDPDDERPKRLCDSIILVKSSREIEGKCVDYLSDLIKTRVMPLGPLFSVVHDDQHYEHHELIQWLETKSDFSTVFVSFGSEYYLKNDEMEEIAFGLELSGVNFIWVLRFPMGEKTRPDEALPQGFLDRVKQRGRIAEKWAPQTSILAHRSIGGFVCPCGWNSVMESIELGVPIIAMPMQLDQPPNARLVVEIGVGMEVLREGNGKLEREEIARVIKEVVVDQKGEHLRGNIKDVKEKMKLRENEDLDEAVELLKQLK